MQFFQPLILRGEAAFRCRVYQQKNLALIGGHILLAPAGHIDREIMNVHLLFLSAILCQNAVMQPDDPVHLGCQPFIVRRDQRG